MKKTIFIHIGPHKTGTTTIQSNLYLNENVLLSSGVLCPKSGRTSKTTAANHNLAWELRKKKNSRFDKDKGTWSDFIDEVKSHPWISKVIISSEDFSLLSTSQIEEIRKKTINYNVKVIIYLRRQDEALQSTWVQQIKFFPKLTNPFSEWVEMNDYQAKNLNYLKIIKNWENIFGRKNIILRLLDPNSFQGTLFSDFLKLCNIQIENIKEGPKKNVSPGAKTIEAIRLFKIKIFPQLPSNHKWQFIVWKIIEFGNTKGWNNKRINFLDTELSKTIMDKYKEPNRYINEKYFNKNGNLFPNTIKKFDEVDNFQFTDFSKNEVVELFSFILQEYGKRFH